MFSSNPILDGGGLIFKASLLQDDAFNCSHFALNLVTWVPSTIQTPKKFKKFKCYWVIQLVTKWSKKPIQDRVKIKVERLCVSKVFHDALVAAPPSPPTYLSTTQKHCYIWSCLPHPAIISIFTQYYKLLCNFLKDHFCSVLCCK